MEKNKSFCILQKCDVLYFYVTDNDQHSPVLAGCPPRAGNTGGKIPNYADVDLEQINLNPTTWSIG